MALQPIETRLGATAVTTSSFEAAGDLRHWRDDNPNNTRWRMPLRAAAKLTCLTAITATMLYAWQGIVIHIQHFSVRPDPAVPVATSLVRFVHSAFNFVPSPKPAVPPKAASPVFAAEAQMSAGQLMGRWEPLILSASQRFGVPARWIRTVIQMESGGRTMSNASEPITSRAGAMGLMQLMPGTYAEMRSQYRLGANPYNPRDNVFAGAAYLRWLSGKYGYPGMFAAYNDGPGNLEARLGHGQLLPEETRNYVVRVETALGHLGHGRLATLTRPNGTPVSIDAAQVAGVRAALPGEYAPGVQTVVTIGTMKQGVRETLSAVTAVLGSRESAAPIHMRRFEASFRAPSCAGSACSNSAT